MYCYRLKREPGQLQETKASPFFLALMCAYICCVGILWQISELVLFRITMKLQLTSQEGQAKKGQIGKLCRCFVESMTWRSKSWKLFINFTKCVHVYEFISLGSPNLPTQRKVLRILKHVQISHGLHSKGSNYLINKRH